MVAIVGAGLTQLIKSSISRVTSADERVGDYWILLREGED
jgi:hypothetical protein